MTDVRLYEKRIRKLEKGKTNKVIDDVKNPYGNQEKEKRGKQKIQTDIRQMKNSVLYIKALLEG